MGNGTVGFPNGALDLAEYENGTVTGAVTWSANNGGLQHATLSGALTLGMDADGGNVLILMIQGHATNNYALGWGALVACPTSSFTILATKEYRIDMVKWNGEWHTAGAVLVK